MLSSPESEDAIGLAANVNLSKSVVGNEIVEHLQKIRWPIAFLRRIKPRFRFSLLSLLVAITVLCLLLGVRATRVDKERRAEAVVARLGGMAIRVSRPELRWYDRLQYDLFGQEWAARVDYVVISNAVISEEDAKLIKLFESVEVLAIEHCTIDRRALPHLSCFRELFYLNVEESRVTEASENQKGESVQFASASKPQMEESIVNIALGSNLIEEIDARHTGMTDDAFKRLQRLPLLHRVVVSEKEVSDKSRHEFKAARPDVYIELVR